LEIDASAHGQEIQSSDPDPVVFLAGLFTKYRLAKGE